MGDTPSDASVRGRILVADDLEFGRGIIKMLLGREYEVVEAANERQAMEALAAEADSLLCVLLSPKLAGAGGRGMLDYMRAARLAERIPVIALVSPSDAEGRAWCRESGVADIVERPYDEDMLRCKVRWNVDRFRRISRIGAARCA